MDFELLVVIALIAGLGAVIGFGIINAVRTHGKGF